MPSVLPEGVPVPGDGSLPDGSLAGVGTRPFGVYVHVPFCATRCGYCDFNTYTPAELGSSASPDSWLRGVRREVALAARVLGQPPVVDTVFVGGGTPSLLGAEGLAAVLDAVREYFPLRPGAEVTTESNPESTSPGFFAGIRAAGFTRVSLGMQSASSRVLTILGRRHSPGRATEAARQAREAGFEHVNLDLIYGTPGETETELRDSVAAVIDAGVDHVSAYSLIVEDGTAFARKVRRGELPMPDDDVLADRYEIVDGLLSAAGLSWYEVSNWAGSAAARCAHNLGYWAGGDWWGIGPGAHSHVGGTRWWNVRHPSAYADALDRGLSPGAGREFLSTEDQRVERIMLAARLVDGVGVDALTPAGRAEAGRLAREGLLDPTALADGRCAVTPAGRLLVDGVVRALIS